MSAKDAKTDLCTAYYSVTTPIVASDEPDPGPVRECHATATVKVYLPSVRRYVPACDSHAYGIGLLALSRGARSLTTL